MTIADRPPPRAALLAERKKLGLTQEELADKIGCARASYALWEQGKARPMPRYWPVMAELFGLSGAEIARIIDHTGAPDLEGHDIPDWLNHRESLILSAGTLTTIVRDAVPGMLQTKAYAKVIERLGPLQLNDDEILERVDMRMAMQDVVHRSKDPLKVLAFIAEIVLWEEADSAEVMADQCSHLIEMGKLSNVTVRLMPKDGKSACARGGFELLTRTDQSYPYMVLLHDPDGVIDYIDDRRRIKGYVDLVRYLDQTSLPPDGSLHQIRQLREMYRK